jgi:myo-inositol-1(or 4)-monophosphatase
VTPLAGFDPADRAAQSALRRIAEEAARAGGAVARRYFRTDLTVRLKADRSEVTDADDAAQAAVIAAIRSHRLSDAFVTEETLALPAGAPPAPAPTDDVLCWAIDPIDGTRNHVRGIPLYVCSVAAMFAGTPLAGAVYDPERDALYSASAIEGLFINGQPAAPRPVAMPESGRRLRPLVAIPSTPRGVIAELVHAGLGHWVCRNLGSTALHLAMVAAGELDAMLADNSRLWDVAAGWVLVTAAGGRMTSPAGVPLFPLDVRTCVDHELPTLAASATVHDDILGS